MVAGKLCGVVFGEFPIRNPAGTADTLEPFVSQPAGGPAVAGVVHAKRFVAVGGDCGLLSSLFNGSDSVQNADAGGPEFDFVN